jgi:low temperature requirement protein LtrA
MSHQPHHNPITKRPLIKIMRPRSPNEVHRASTPLELLFDLVFVVAIALAAARLHHGIAENHTAHAVLSFFMVFFPIWWAWMNFTWFASAYDIDDVPYRLLTMVQLTGALIMAAGVPKAFDVSDFTVITIGYLVMRLALVAQWLRAWRADPLRRKIITRYIVGLSIVQAGWIGLLLIPNEYKLIGFLFMVALEMAVPVWSESANAKQMTPFHREHIIERYGLLTIIVLGESILSASNAMQGALSNDQLNGSVLKIGIGGVLIVFSMWWTYFQQTEHKVAQSLESSFLWGYGHYFIFASAAAVGAGLSVAVDYATEVAHISSVVAGLAVAVPVAVFALSVGVVHGRIAVGGWMAVLFLSLIAATLVTPWLPDSILWLGVIFAIFLGAMLWINRGEEVASSHH